MGDVAMTVPVLQQLLQQHPDLTITMLTQNFLSPLFEQLERTAVHAIETKGRHKGLTGLYKLFGELKKQYQFDAIADLHNVLRSKVITSLFTIAGFKTASIDKGRKGKRELTSRGNKRFVQLKSSFQRYADVFNSLGLPLILDVTQSPLSKRPLPTEIASQFAVAKKNICIAPFARHEEKTYPPAKMKRIIQKLSGNPQYQVFLLGGGKNEVAILNEWVKEFPGVVNLAGKFSFRDELAIISHMDLMVSMDSANMHLASLFGVRVISVWGATHPFAGFYGWAQPASNAIQIDLYCRPCSVFGNKPCFRGDHACMQQLPEDVIIEKVITAV